MSPNYIVEILDKAQQPITQLNSFVPLDTSGDILTYGTKLSDAGLAKFRLVTNDPVLTKYGDILQPWKNHVRITRDNSIVWQGYIQDLPGRNRRYIEVRASTYLAELKKLLVKHDTFANGEDTRTFKSGSLAGAVIAVLNEAKAKATGRIIAGLSIGTIDNPAFPAGFTDALKNNIGGQPWNFSDNFQLKFDFKDTLYVIASLANYSFFDFELTNDLVFNFKKRFGADKPELVFEYGQWGMIEDFEAPLDGSNQVNSLTGVAADIDSNMLKDVATDQAAIADDGILEGVAAYADVKNQDVLLTRDRETLRLNSRANTELRVVLNQRAYPIGVYGLGDVVTMIIKYGAINENQQRQIVGITTKVHNTGREHVILTTNTPRVNT